MRNNQKVIDDSINIIKNIFQNQVMSGLRKLGKEALKYAQDNHGFKNQTMNLEDSYGYAIYYNGSIVEMILSDKKANEPRKYKGETWWGRDAAEAFLRSHQPKDGYSLVVVAGQFYAAWVEAFYSLDVLTGAYQLTEKDFQKVFKNIPADFEYNKLGYV